MLQHHNDYTTPEQAQRLLALGVPRESANCAIYSYEAKKTPQVRFYCNFRGNGRAGQGWRWTSKNCPAWTYGRLVEICFECYDNNGETAKNVTADTKALENGLIEEVIVLMESNPQMFDFSKLANL